MSVSTKSVPTKTISTGGYDAPQIAAIAAAVREFLDAEERSGAEARGYEGYSGRSQISAWRGNAMFANAAFAAGDAFAARPRSWTDRD